MTKFILFIAGIVTMYLSITGKLIQYVKIKDPIAEIYIFILGLIMTGLSLIYIFEQPYKNR
jgi:hypothetical protein